MKQLKHQAAILEQLVELLVRYQDSLGSDKLIACEECGRIKVPETQRPHYKRFKQTQAMLERIIDWIDNDYFPDGTAPSVPAKARPYQE